MKINKIREDGNLFRTKIKMTTSPKPKDTIVFGACEKDLFKKADEGLRK